VNGFVVPRKDPARKPLDLIFHPYSSKRSTPGFPDLTMVHPQRNVLIFAELKTEKGRITQEQGLWGEALRRVEEASGGVVRYRLWRPSHWEEIVEELGGMGCRLFV
jgi:hypothetical protein